MQATAGSAHALAQRLRALRERHWPRLTITQRQLAEALGVSVPLISSWENTTKPVTPPPERLIIYAAFFATRRSIDSRPFRVLADGEFTAEELLRRAELEQELLTLRERTLGGGPPSPESVDQPVASGPWHLGDKNNITLVCAQLPPGMLKSPLAHPDNVDYTDLYRFSDLDALFELHGHIRAANPDSDVLLRSSSELHTDDYSSHLVFIGGVDWNPVLRRLLVMLRVPVTQLSRESDPEGASFEAMVEGEPHRYRPKVLLDGAQERLLEDVAHFFRGRNPFNRKRTVTICNGMYSRGVYGAVRSLTDRRFRDRNAAYLGKRFAGSDSYSLLYQVTVFDGKVLTPDWTAPGTVLHEWHEATG